MLIIFNQNGIDRKGKYFSVIIEAIAYIVYVCLWSKYEVQMIRFYNIKMKDNFEGEYQEDEKFLNLSARSIIVRVL